MKYKRRESMIVEKEPSKLEYPSIPRTFPQSNYILLYKFVLPRTPVFFCGGEVEGKNIF